MPDDSRSGDVDKILADEKAIEDRKQALIADLLKQREAAIKDFDEKLAKLGHHFNSAGKSKRSHHKKPSADGGEAAVKPKGKP